MFRSTNGIYSKEFLLVIVKPGSTSVVHFSTNTAKQRTIFFKIISQSCQFLCACFLLVGKAAVVSVLSLETNLSALLPFVESTGRSLF